MTLHPQAQALLDTLASSGSGRIAADVSAMRAQAREAALAVPDRIGLDLVTDVDADGVPARLYRPRVGAPVLLYVHGGGWVFHDLETHDVFCRYLAHVTGWALLAVDYRRAPEHPYPAALDDVERAAHWLQKNDRVHRVDASWLAGLGDSAGANLVAGVCVRDPELLDQQVLLYPATDRRAALDAALSSPALLVDEMERLWEAYAPGKTGDHPEVSVLKAANLAEHPPAVVITAEHDPLRAQGEAYAAALTAAGVSVTAHCALGMVHSFWRQPDVFDASRALVVAVGAWLDTARGTARDV